MNSNAPDVFVHLLIDNGLLQQVAAPYTETNSESRPVWLTPIYAGNALAVSPILIDLEAAYEAGDLDRPMTFLNALTPALHVSIIETGLSAEQLARHLRRFIFIHDPEGKQFTLRYADCAVLASLSMVLTPGQWATMRNPINRWDIHDRSGALIPLPSAQPSEEAPTPFRLDQTQLVALDEASEPDHIIAKVKMMRRDEPLPGNCAEHYQWAKSAFHFWREAGNVNPIFLTLLTESTILTQGKILFSSALQSLFASDQVESFSRKLRELSEKINATAIS